MPRNQPATLLKYPKDGVAYQAVVPTLPTALVRAHYAQQPPAPARPATPEALLFAKSPLLKSLFASLLPYLELEQHLPERVFAAKLTEALEILRSLDPRSEGVLANFAEPGKVSLVEFMEANYQFNLPLATFSYLTGRSLTTFKRDFHKAFQLSPQRWLTHKRLALAHYQLTEQSRKPVELPGGGLREPGAFLLRLQKAVRLPPDCAGRAEGSPPAGCRLGGGHCPALFLGQPRLGRASRPDARPGGCAARRYRPGLHSGGPGGDWRPDAGAGRAGQQRPRYAAAEAVGPDQERRHASGWEKASSAVSELL